MAQGAKTALLPPGGGYLLAPVGSERILTPEDFTAEQREFYRTARKFAVERVAQNARRIEDKDFALDRQLIREAGKLPVQRDALYRVVREYGRADAPALAPAGAGAR